MDRPGTWWKNGGASTSASITRNKLIAFTNKIIALFKRVTFLVLFGYLIYKVVESVQKLESKETGSHSFIGVSWVEPYSVKLRDHVKH